MAGDQPDGKLECADIMHFGVALGVFVHAAKTQESTTTPQNLAFAAATAHFVHKLYEMKHPSDLLHACLPSKREQPVVSSAPRP